MSSTDMFVIVNPASNNGKTGQRWSAIQSLLQTRGLHFDAVLTTARGHATELAQTAAARGTPTLIVVGGDGTVNEVVNGLMLAGGEDPARTSQVKLGIVHSGTGGDFLRYLGFPKEPQAVVARLQTGQTRRLDAGHVTCTREGGEKIDRYFVNVAGLGYDGDVSVRVNRSSLKSLGPKLGYLLNVLLALATYQNKRVRVKIDGRALSGEMNSVIVCNCQYFGGGMWVAPHAIPDDGLFDVIILGNMSKLEFLANVPKVYNGTHLTHPKVLELRAREVEVEADQPMFLEAEGDLVGAAPAKFRLIPGALSVIV